MTFKTIILLIFISSTAFCQEIVIKGKVIDQRDSVPIENAKIKFYSGSEVLYVTVSDSYGNFNIKENDYKKANYFIISGVNLKTLTISSLPVISKRNSNGYDIGEFRLYSNTIQLKNVNIIANRRYRDTTIIDLSGQNFNRSITVSDLLSNSKDLHQDKDGQIYYRGKLVSDVVVNGREFFGKNNRNVFNLLPALMLGEVQIIETNIDSTSNTTMLNSAVKINLKLKKKYESGRFGNASLGYGTSNRNIVATNLYNYKDGAQLLFSINSNNINVGETSLQDPVISFSPNSNNLINQSGKITYSNILKKLEVGFSAKGKIEKTSFEMQSERQEQLFNQSSNTRSKSTSKYIEFPDARLNLKYNFDDQNNVEVIYANAYRKRVSKDSLKYSIELDSLHSSSTVDKERQIFNDYSSIDVIYNHKFLNKKGRSLNLVLNKTNKLTENNESSIVSRENNRELEIQSIENLKKLEERMSNFNINFVEPLGYSTALNFFISYSNKKSIFKDNRLSGSISNNIDIPALDISNKYYQFGTIIKRSFNKASFEGKISSLGSLQETNLDGNVQYVSFSNLNLDLKGEFKINKDKNISTSYILVTRYPDITQSTNINNSFDLISQSIGNVNIKPEVDHSLKATYNFKSDNFEAINLNSDFHFFRSKFGSNAKAIFGQPQYTFIDNIGNAFSASIGMNIQNNSDKLNFIYSNNIIYQEQPSRFNGVFNKNNGILFNQSLSTNKVLIKDFLSINPLCAFTYGNYYYSGISPTKLIIVTYSDKISFVVSKFYIDLYPLANYNYNIVSSASLSMNMSVKRSLFEKTMVVWFQAYDIFNSFKYNNNLLGSSYKETTIYSNINRYVVFGMNLKFNNIK